MRHPSSHRTTILTMHHGVRRRCITHSAHGAKASGGGVGRGHKDLTCVPCRSARLAWAREGGVELREGVRSTYYAPLTTLHLLGSMYARAHLAAEAE